MNIQLQAQYVLIKDGKDTYYIKTDNINKLDVTGIPKDFIEKVHKSQAYDKFKNQHPHLFI